MPRPRLPSPPSAFIYRAFSTAPAALRPAACSTQRAANEPDVLPSVQQRAQSRIKQREQRAGAVSPFLTDSFGRKHDYLRISLTEKCNLRCTYCMPEQGVPLLPRENLLTTDEVERVARMFVGHGVSKIRLTGGEPTVRKDLVDVVARLGRLPLQSLGMTSNGISLKRKLPSLVAAGLTHLNISLDTLDPMKYELMTRRRGFSAVMEALEVARSLKSEGLTTKLNVVVIRGLNDMEVPDFVELTREMDITVRMIEYMPFEDNRWSTKKLVPSSELVNRIRDIHPSLAKLQDPHSDTTRSWRIPGYKGKFGFISSMSDHFCGECSRLRVGADGGVKVCLFGPPVLSLRPLLRPSATAPLGASDEVIMQEIGSAVWGKKFAHNGLGAPSGATLRRSTAGSPLFGPRRISVHLLHRPSTHGTARWSSSSASDRLTHIDPLTGRASMVSVSAKEDTLRSATAVGRIYLNEAAWFMIDLGEAASSTSSTSDFTPPTMKTKKGDVLTTAHLAAIMSAKSTSLLIPLCHPLLLTSIKVTLTPRPSTRSIEVEATVECHGKTGVEMEALMAVSTGCLTVWDMTKAVSGKEARIGDIIVKKKSGGRSGDWERKEGEGR